MADIPNTFTATAEDVVHFIPTSAEMMSLVQNVRELAEVVSASTARIAAFDSKLAAVAQQKSSEPVFADGGLPQISAVCELGILIQLHADG